MKGLIAGVVAFAVASASGDEFLVKREFFDAIRFVESTDGRYLGDQDGGRSYGPYQISAAYLQDANEYLGTSYTLRQVIDDDAVAVAVMCGYWNRYLPKDREVTYEILARIHNGGPKGYEMESTLPYWEKVKAKMEELENADEDQAGRN
jgi:hypothetical protein